MNAGSGSDEPASFDLTIATAAHDEASNVEGFLSQAFEAIRSLELEGEVLFLDDGSQDGTAAEVHAFAHAHPEIPIRLISNAQCRGLSAAITKLARNARGELVCMLPSDLESWPAEDVPRLVKAMDPATDVVAGCRVGRGDGKRFASSMYRLLNRLFFGLRVRDGNWIKLVRRETVADLELRDGWYRYMLAILANRGCRIREVDVRWHPRQHGSSHFGIGRFLPGLADLITVKLHLDYRQRPLLPFLRVGLFAAFVWLVLVAIAMLVEAGASPLRTLLLVGLGPALFVALLALGLGLVAELSVHGRRRDAERQEDASEDLLDDVGVRPLRRRPKRVVPRGEQSAPR